MSDDDTRREVIKALNDAIDRLAFAWSRCEGSHLRYEIEAATKQTITARDIACGRPPYTPETT